MRDQFIPDPNTNWVNVEKYYSGAPFDLKSGGKFSLMLTFQNQLEKEDEVLLPSFFSEWTYGEDRYIKPFKLLTYSHDIRTVYVEYEIVRKSNNIDEIRLLLIDCLAVYEVSGNPILNVKVEQLID